MKDPVEINESDILHYSMPGPRYTSYPTANVWSKNFKVEDFLNALHTGGHSSGLSLYIHIPFCEKLCHFCACNRVIDHSHSKDEELIEALKSEMNSILEHLPHPKPIEQLHLGGGTPTYLSPERLDRLLQIIRKKFSLASEAELSIEVNPVVTKKEHIDVLGDHGFNRISMGVQDFDLEVQKIINRYQTFEQTQRLIEYARERRFKSLNLDLIYGLPKQNLRTFENTLALVSKLRPERLAVYSFARVPWKQPFHRRFSDDDLPEGLEKVKLYLLARSYLEAEGYEPIGMDHFALPHDELAVAQKEKRLHRNFMGYTTRPDLDLLGFGPSAISSFGDVFSQNTKDLSKYLRLIADHSLAATVGHRLSPDDILRRSIIASLMCNFRVDFQPVEERFSLRFMDYFSREMSSLSSFIKDGLIELSSDGFQVIGRGKILVRNVAMLFDQYLPITSEDRKFSGTI